MTFEEMLQGLHDEVGLTQDELVDLVDGLEAEGYMDAIREGVEQYGDDFDVTPIMSAAIDVDGTLARQTAEWADAGDEYDPMWDRWAAGEDADMHNSEEVLSQAAYIGALRSVETEYEELSKEAASRGLELTPELYAAYKGGDDVGPAGPGDVQSEVDPEYALEVIEDNLAQHGVTLNPDVFGRYVQAFDGDLPAAMTNYAKTVTESHNADGTPVYPQAVIDTFGDDQEALIEWAEQANDWVNESRAERDQHAVNGKVAEMGPARGGLDEAAKEMHAQMNLAAEVREERGRFAPEAEPHTYETFKEQAQEASAANTARDEQLRQEQAERNQARQERGPGAAPSSFDDVADAIVGVA